MSPTSPSTSASAVQALDPAPVGVGARLTVSVMSDDYVNILLGALGEARDAASSGLVIQSDEVSTYVGGAENDVLAYVTDLIAKVSASGAHVVAHVQFSRGCPGTQTGNLNDPNVHIPDLEPLAPTGVAASAQWALYPLTDGPDADHMPHILGAIERAREAGTVRGPLHFVTELGGDLSDVLTTVADGWLSVGRVVPHVVTHVTISTNHPGDTEVAR